MTAPITSRKFHEGGVFSSLVYCSITCERYSKNVSMLNARWTRGHLLWVKSIPQSLVKALTPQSFSCSWPWAHSPQYPRGSRYLISFWVWLLPRSLPSHSADPLQTLLSSPSLLSTAWIFFSKGGCRHLWKPWRRHWTPSRTWPKRFPDSETCKGTVPGVRYSLREAGYPQRPHPRGELF